MNRRNFIRNLAGIGLFSILPGAGRVWKATKVINPMTIPNPNWVNAPYECAFIFWGGMDNYAKSVIPLRFQEEEIICWMPKCRDAYKAITESL